MPYFLFTFSVIAIPHITSNKVMVGWPKCSSPAGPCLPMISLYGSLSKYLVNTSMTNHSSSQLYFQDDLTLVKSWYVNGRNYSHTCEDWLKKQDRNNKQGILELENDAEKKGLDREEGRKVTHRNGLMMTLRAFPRIMDTFHSISNIHLMYAATHRSLYRWLTSRIQLLLPRHQLRQPLSSWHWRMVSDSSLDRDRCVWLTRGLPRSLRVSYSWV